MAINLLMNEAEAQDLARNRRNIEYLQKLDESIAQAKRGEVVMYTAEQMRAMEDEA
ncbi:MAG: toxin-antitoxin system antitoxin subunit [Defluviitaleaceae bacterium]|nr:toxin-antitoxin system antitoxin subunit [Defluviitaleaceae bacterium]